MRAYEIRPGMYYVRPMALKEHWKFDMWVTIKELSGDHTMWLCRHVISGTEAKLPIVAYQRVQDRDVRKLFGLAREDPLPMPEAV